MQIAFGASQTAMSRKTLWWMSWNTQFREPRSWRQHIAPGERRLALRAKRNPGFQDPRRSATSKRFTTSLDQTESQPANPTMLVARRAICSSRPVGLRLGGIDWGRESIARRQRCCAHKPRASARLAELVFVPPGATCCRQLRGFPKSKPISARHVPTCHLVLKSNERDWQKVLRKKSLRRKRCRTPFCLIKVVGTLRRAVTGGRHGGACLRPYKETLLLGYLQLPIRRIPPAPKTKN